MSKLDTIKITKINEVYIHISADRGILREISDRFTFFAKNYKFTPAFRNTNWDGKIRVFDNRNNLIYAGLLDEIKQFAAERDYDVVMDYADFAEKELSRIEAIDFIKKIISEVKIPDFEQEIREYQLLSFMSMVRHNRRLLLSPTSSGKSFMIYLLIRYYNLPTLIIVDSTAAVRQMASDLASYGYDTSNIHMIYTGQEKNLLKPVVVSTWQSIALADEDYLCKFGLIIGDEAHHFQAKTFKEFMEKATEAKYRFGFTGTIDEDSECNVMILTGLFGKVERFISTAELIEQGYATPIKIKAIVFQYNEESKKQIYKIVDSKKKIEYNTELKFIEKYRKRNNFIKNLACSLEGNTLIFFQHEEHGEELYSLLAAELAKRTDRSPDQVHIAHGNVSGVKRDNLRPIFENNTGHIGVVSYGTFQTSISIKNIHNMIFASPAKSLIRVLQSIGRGLRLHDSKEFVTLFDLSDNMIIGSTKNHTIKHFKIRMQIYAKENFKVKIYNVKLENEK